MNSRKISRFFVYFFLTVGALIMLLPFFWMFSSAFKTTQEINRFPPQWLPSHLSLENFKRAFEMAPFGRYFVNSVVVMVVSVSVTTFTTILAAFAFSRLRFPGRNLIFSLLLSLMMIPFEMLIITNYTTVVNLKVYDTLYALILPFTSSIFYTYILKNFFDSVSDSLYWSARIDGSSNWRFLWKVMVPMARPSLMTIILLNGLASWNSFMWPMYVRLLSGIADGRVYGRGFPGRHPVPVRPQIHRPRRCARRPERLSHFSILSSPGRIFLFRVSGRQTALPFIRISLFCKGNTH